MRTNFHPSRAGQILHALLLCHIHAVQFLVFIEDAEILFHLGDFILEMEEHPIIERFESPIQWGQLLLLRFVVRRQMGSQKPIAGMY